MNADALLTSSLRATGCGEAVARILAAALDAVEPRRLVADAAPKLAIPQGARVIVLGAGKAAVGMARGLVDALGDRIATGLVVAQHAPDTRIGPIAVQVAGHPEPDARSLAAGDALLRAAEQAGAGDVVLFLLSGGASALVCAARPPLGLEDLRATTRSLLACGADIRATNTVRKHIDAIKGGGLARAAAPAQVITLALSDVVGDDPGVIGSGPTVADPTTFADAVALAEGLPQPVQKFLREGAAGRHRETAKPGELRHGQFVVVAGNADAAAAAEARARLEGFAMEPRLALDGEARSAGAALGRALVDLAGGGRPACIVAAGETTVTVVGDGTGGRTLEVALAAAPVALGLPNVVLATLATDGEDGPSRAAGAVVTGATLARAIERGLDPMDHLMRNDALPFFRALDDAIITGPTGTNVCDLAVLAAC